jgi:beta-amylase
MVSFKQQFSELLGSVVTDALIGLGPKGELRYPSNPLDTRWNFPGIGEFQVGHTAVQRACTAAFVIEGFCCMDIVLSCMEPQCCQTRA